MRLLKVGLRYLLALFMIQVGVLHFTSPQGFLDIMPPYLPWHLELVYISGFFEILGGVGLLVPRLRRIAAWGLVALFVAVLPANINMAVNGLPFKGQPVEPWMAWLRVFLQPVLIAWAYWFTKPDAPADESPPEPR